MRLLMHSNMRSPLAWTKRSVAALRSARVRSDLGPGGLGHAKSLWAAIHILLYTYLSRLAAPTDPGVLVDPEHGGLVRQTEPRHHQLLLDNVLHRYDTELLSVLTRVLRFPTDLSHSVAADYVAMLSVPFQQCESHALREVAVPPRKGREEHDHASIRRVASVVDVCGDVVVPRGATEIRGRAK